MNNSTISELVKTSISSIKDITKGNITIGEPIKFNESIIFIISSVKYGFISAGIDQDTKPFIDATYPFGGGSGIISNIKPLCIVVFKDNDLKLYSINDSTKLYEDIIKSIPDISKAIFK